MNLLLLFSALLSALTGVSGQARVIAPQAVSQKLVSTAPASVAAAKSQARPVQPLATLADLATATPRIAPGTPLVALADILTNRRRE